MYNLDEVVNFIEKKNNVKLYEYQKKMLQYIIEGKTFFVPRKSGRTIVLEWFIDYLRNKQNKHWTYGFDEHIGIQEVMKENKWIFDRYNLKDNTINFKQEYECDWFGKSDKT